MCGGLARSLLIALLALSLMPTALFAAEPAPSCRGSWNVVGACFSMHGRLSLASPASRRTPRAQISQAATGRTVGVLGIALAADGPDVLPPDVMRLLQPEPTTTDIDGDYLVCPLDREDHLRMQMVCIESASHLSKRRR
jgi:hypothetical protein